MARYLLVAGIDLGTSFTKVVLRDNNTPGQSALAVTFSHFSDGLLPSIVYSDGTRLFPPAPEAAQPGIPYLKMLAAHMSNGNGLHDGHPLRIPEIMQTLCADKDSLSVVRSLLAYYFAVVITEVEAFVRSSTRWSDFDSSGNSEDHFVYQLAVPTGLLGSGVTEKFFRDALVASYELRSVVASDPHHSVVVSEWIAQVEKVLSEDPATLHERHKWRCLIYPEVAAAVQTVFRSPNARDGLYITMDVGAGTVDLNAFRRHTDETKTHLCYYSARVSPLGSQNLVDPHQMVAQRRRASELMEDLREELCALFRQALRFQPNHGTARGQRTWDRATLYLFGGGAAMDFYGRGFIDGMSRAGIFEPRSLSLPSARDLTKPAQTDFGRFAVAYGLSFFKPSLDNVQLPGEILPFRELCPPDESEPPRQYGFNWED